MILPKENLKFYIDDELLSFILPLISCGKMIFPYINNVYTLEE